MFNVIFRDILPWGDGWIRLGPLGDVGWVFFFVLLMLGRCYLDHQQLFQAIPLGDILGLGLAPLCLLPLTGDPVERIGMDLIGPLEQTARWHYFVLEQNVIPISHGSSQNLNTQCCRGALPCYVQVWITHTHTERELKMWTGLGQKPSWIV